ncbi:site-specific integrase [Vulcaniibacterium tengchongense]|uniref:Phage integrase family protein n=1 Tax=Vulcaniibacterium tengchongense TaxID=1273429 RepID=A0A3N4UV90_9GAMM|nr:tyrosine-type recombinase/integrase [Vulcaniibacterium tengchongense]RPE74662.1 phage integrase family protein [Vulcaniibacterium tengchongense]
MGGRKRKFKPDIPAHIDQAALPKGIYWEDNRWYILEPHPEGGRPRKRTVAYASARLSELHAIVETARGEDPRGSVSYITEQFHRSSEFASLAPRTQKDYRWLAQEACSYVLKDGSPLGRYPVDRMTVPMVQRLVESLAMGRPAAGLQPALPATPTKANHILRYLRRVFAWGMRHGLCRLNPAKGVRQVAERGDNRMPEPEAFAAVLRFARERGQRMAHTEGSVPPYLWAAMMLAYNLRLRGLEVCTLTDAHADDVGIRSNRRKGSLDNVTRWNAELREAWEFLQDYRRRVTEANKRPVPLRPEQRRVIVSQSGTPLTKSALDTAWQRMITMAIRERVITPDQRFSLHGLKHRGITDTAGNIADKQDAAGHRERRMTQRYNHELPVVEPPKLAKPRK